MAYQQGDTIEASTYNTFAGNVNTIIGTGSWGQWLRVE